ncbi:MAG: c-type cytochrome [Pirellulaceae bacterium]
MEQFLTPQLAPETGIAAINSLEAARVEGLAQQLLELRQTVGPKLGSQILTFLLSHTDSTQHLLDAIENGSVRFSDLKLDQRQAILNHATPSIASHAAELMKSQGALVTSNRQALVDEWLPITKNPGDATNGLAMFKKHCATCHIHGELGTAIGPNLTGMAVHPKEELLVNVLDPSRSVETNFQIYQVITVNGQVISGMLAGESANSIRVIDSTGKEKQVLREDLEQLVSSPKSLMPEGFESSMTKAELTDLLTFLTQRGKYTPLTTSKGCHCKWNQGSAWLPKSPRGQV